MEGIETCAAKDDCDTLIVKKAIELAQSMPVHVRAEDTDILVMLVHHIPRCPNDIQMITKSDTYSIMDICNKLTDVGKDRLLFVHSFTGCDTVSGIYRHSKNGLLQKLCKTDEDLAVRFGT